MDPASRAATMYLGSCDRSSHHATRFLFFKRAGSLHEGLVEPGRYLRTLGRTLSKKPTGFQGPVRGQSGI